MVSAPCRTKPTASARPGRTATTPARLAVGLVLLVYVHAFARVRNLWRRLLGRSHVSILVYHRVSDAYRDGVTVGVDRFVQHLRCLRRHYEVISLSEFLARRGQPRRRHAVVITFDDGYADNKRAAAILLREGLPAAFFVSTRIVGTDQAFPHDLRRLGHAVATLDWATLREMALQGFAIGNHTAHHADLASLPVDEALEEVRTALDDLRRELPAQPSHAWLAYPYGGVAHMSDAVRRRLAGLGITACLSAYGGTNPPDFDSMNILRQGVDHRMSPLWLRATIEGWSWRT